jgi:hydrogenase expression/formation protein HypC
MCLGIPGRVERIERGAGALMGAVSFGGITREVCLAYLPDVQVGEYVVVHVGFAISRIDEREAQEVFRLLERAGELGELAPIVRENDPDGMGP